MIVLCMMFQAQVDYFYSTYLFKQISKVIFYLFHSRFLLMISLCYNTVQGQFFKSKTLSQWENLREYIKICQICQPQYVKSKTNIRETLFIQPYQNTQKFQYIPSMKQQDQSQKLDSSLQNQQSCSYIWKKLKNSIFDVLFVLLDNSQDEQSMFGLIFETGVDYVQMMAFPFNSVVISVWNANDTLNGVTNFFNNFNVSTYIPGVGFDTFLVMLYSLIFLIIVVICDIAYVAYSFSKKRFRFTFPLIFMAKVVPIFVTVLFLPIMETLLQVVNCQNSEDGTNQVLQSFPDVVCWQGWHLFHTTITLLFSSFFVFISCVVALALFQPRMSTNRLTARQNSTGQVVFIINKIICQFIFSFSPFDGTYPYCLLLFALSGWLFFVYNIAQPYYDKRASKFFRICSSYYFWTNLMLLVSQLLIPYDFQDSLVIWICGMIFIGITIIFERKSNIDTLFQSSLKFKSGQQLESHLKYVLQLHHSRNQDKNSYMLLLGYIQKHIQLCLEQDCPLKDKKIKHETGKQQQQHSCKQLLKQIQRMFTYGLKKYPQCTKLQLTFAFFYMQKYDNTTKAYQHFRKSLTTQPSFGEQFIIYRFTKIINQKLEQQQNNEEDLIQLIRFDNHVTLCEEGMMISSKLHKQFWNQLRQQSPILDRLNKIGARIIETCQMIKENYHEVVRLSNNGPTIIDLQWNYALFLLYICHENVEGKGLLELVRNKMEMRKRRQLKLFKQLYKNQIDELMNTKKCLVVVQLRHQQNANQSYAQIVQVNRPLLQLTKYREEQLKDKKLTKILPQIFQQIHDTKITSWLNNHVQQLKQAKKAQSIKSINQKHKQKQKQKKFHDSYIGEERIGYIKDSLGYIKKVKYTVHYFGLMDKFITEMRFIPGNTIICNNEGIIMEMTIGLIYEIPKISSKFSLEDMLGSGILEKLKNNDKKELTMQVQVQNEKSQTELSHTPKQQPKIFEIKFELLEINTNEYPRQTTFNIDHLLQFTSDKLPSHTAIIIHITEKRIYRKFTICFDNRNDAEESLGVENKRVNVLSGIQNVINQYYSEMKFSGTITSSVKQDQEAQENLETRRRGHRRTYTRFQANDGKQWQIKIFRYRQPTMIRIYLDDLLNEQSDYDYEQRMADLQAKLSIQKMQDVNYQQSVKKALNTYIYHPQVIYLFIISILVMVVFMVLLFLAHAHYQVQNVERNLSKMQEIGHGLDDVELISTQLLAVLFSDGFNQSLVHLRNSTIRVNSLPNQVIPGYTFEDNSIASISLTNALIRIQANLVRYLQHLDTHPQTQISSMLSTVYYSYLTKVLQAISHKYEPADFTTNQANQKTDILFVYLGLCVALVGAFTGIWIYYSLKVSFKIYEVLVWFLDISFQYIKFAQKQCTHFTKIYPQQSPKQSNQPLPNLTQAQLIQQYKQQKAPEEACQQQQTQSMKNRQILISRYRKQSLFTLCKFTEIWKFVVFVFMLGLMVGFVIVHFGGLDRGRKVEVVVQLYMKEYVWINALPIVNRIAVTKAEDSGVWTIFTQAQLTSIKETVIKNMQASQSSLKQFSKYILLNTKNSASDLGILNKPIQYQYANICSLTHNPQCDTIINGTLQAGYSSFKQYVQSSADYQVVKNQMDELEKALRIATPFLFDILIELVEQERSYIRQDDFLVTLCFYLYVVTMGFIFAIPWSLYLRRMNIKLNQTIQILNVIPMSLIPVGRKQTREFLRWIVIKASQKQSQNQQD